MVNKETENLIGQRFGKMVVVSQVRAQCDIVCDCGNTKTMTRYKLSRFKSCGCDLKTLRKDTLSGKQFGKLLVTHSVRGSDNRIRYSCKCECGTVLTETKGRLTSGFTTSCGCDKSACDSITGKSFGLLVAIQRNEKNPKRWDCRCDCGNEVTLIEWKLTCGKTTSCGCNRKMVPYVESIGKRFGKLVVLSADASGKCVCKCDCGNEKLSILNALRSGNTKSCGLNCGLRIRSAKPRNKKKRSDFETIPTHCKRCQKTIKQSGHVKIFCGVDCSLKYKIEQSIKSFECEVCGVLVQRKGIRAKTCGSEACIRLLQISSISNRSKIRIAVRKWELASGIRTPKCAVKNLGKCSLCGMQTRKGKCQQWKCEDWKGTFKKAKQSIAAAATRLDQSDWSRKCATASKSMKDRSPKLQIEDTPIRLWSTSIRRQKSQLKNQLKRSQLTPWEKKCENAIGHLKRRLCYRQKRLRHATLIENSGALPRQLTLWTWE